MDNNSTIKADSMERLERFLYDSVEGIKAGDIVAFTRSYTASHERDALRYMKMEKGETVKVLAVCYWEEDGDNEACRVTFTGTDEYTVQRNALRFVARG